MTSAQSILIQSARPEQSTRPDVVSLTALVVGSMTGAGVFSLPQNMAKGASPGALQ